MRKNWKLLIVLGVICYCVGMAALVYAAFNPDKVEEGYAVAEAKVSDIKQLGVGDKTSYMYYVSYEYDGVSYIDVLVKRDRFSRLDMGQKLNVIFPVNDPMDIKEYTHLGGFGMITYIMVTLSLVLVYIGYLMKPKVKTRYR